MNGTHILELFRNQLADEIARRDDDCPRFFPLNINPWLTSDNPHLSEPKMSNTITRTERAEGLPEQVRTYIREAVSDNTRRAYADGTVRPHVVARVDGREYALNGAARGAGLYADGRAVMKPNPWKYGATQSLIDKGLGLCR